MCRLLGWSSDHPVTVSDVLGAPALARLQELATVHADGWGMAWYAPDDPTMHRHRSTAPAGDDGQFSTFIHETATRRGILHLRMATPGLGLEIGDTHPFLSGGMAFAHNGAIEPADKLDLLLPPGADAPEGSTDSERYFARLRGDLGSRRGGAAVAKAAGRVLSRIRWYGMDTHSLNAMLLTPDELQVISLHDPQSEPQGVQLWPGSFPTHPPYLDLDLLRTDGLSIAASSGILREEADTIKLDPACVVTMDDEGAVTRISPITERIVAGLRHSA